MNKAGLYGLPFSYIQVRMSLLASFLKKGTEDIIRKKKSLTKNVIDTNNVNKSANIGNEVNDIIKGRNKHINFE